MTAKELASVKEWIGGSTRADDRDPWGWYAALLDHVAGLERELFDIRFERDGMRLSLAQVDAINARQRRAIYRLAVLVHDANCAWAIADCMDQEYIDSRKVAGDRIEARLATIEEERRGE